ncbi:MAG: trigger factor [Verrucomicrobia bacterium]|nr:trigger factor [Verrucomicrobiota bacterium]
MNVTMENLAPCKKLLRVEIEAKEVDEAFESMMKDFQRQVSLPGFRPGKAPRDMVLKKYDKDIHDEVKKKLIPDAYRKAVEQQKLDVVGYPDIEEIQFGRGQALQFAATIETAPEIQLPEYKGLPVKREVASVTEADIERALNLLREQQTNFQTVARPVQTGDVVVVNYTGACNGKPITETAPTAKGLNEAKNFWINVEPNSFITGFAMQLIGATAGEKRTVNVDFAADFVTKELAGQKGVYEVEVVEVKEKLLPALDEAFAKAYGAESLEKLRDGVRTDLQNELTFKQNKSIRNQLVRALLDRVNFDLPESVLTQETRNVVYDIVRENQQRGVARELIEQQKEQIYSVASHSAKDRVKAAYLIQRIAEKEDIKVSQTEVAARVQHLARMYQITPEKFLKDLQKRNGLVEIYDQVANEKVMEFLQNNAKIEDVPAKTEEAPASNPS